MKQSNQICFQIMNCADIGSSLKSVKISSFYNFLKVFFLFMLPKSLQVRIESQSKKWHKDRLRLFRLSKSCYVSSCYFLDVCNFAMKTRRKKNVLLKSNIFFVICWFIFYRLSNSVSTLACAQFLTHASYKNQIILSFQN